MLLEYTIELFHIVKGVHKTDSSCTGTHKIIPIHYNLLMEKVLKSNLKPLFRTKYNEINMRSSDVQNRIYYKKKCK